MKPRTEFRLFGHQADALESSAPELLVGGDDRRSGKSFLLRVAAIVAAGGRTPARVVLVRLNEGDLQRDHMAGPAGLPALLADMRAHGAAELVGSEIRLATGSTIRWSGCAREAEIARLLEQPIDVLLVDDLDEIPQPLYERLRDRALTSPHPGRRIIATTSRLGSSGWVAKHWNGSSPPGRIFMPFAAADVHPSLAAPPARRRYRETLEQLHGGQMIWAPHTEAMVDAIDRWVADEFDHLALFVPSQHGKTEVGPRGAVPHILSLYPSDWCSIASYMSDIANSRSADARENYLRLGGELAAGRKRVNEWLTLAGGGCWSAGTAAGQTGRSSTWAFLDDGDKDWADAVNATRQTKKRRWYGSTYRSRESMFATEGRRQKMCVTATRWDPGDLAGYALSQGEETWKVSEGLAGERWAILCLSAVYDPAVLDGYRELYPHATILEDFRREPGEPIWESRRSRDDWRMVRVQRGPLIFDCECQQSPRGAERGGKFVADWFRRLTRDPAHAGVEVNEHVYQASCRAWDLGATQGAGDYTAGAKLGRDRDGGRVIARNVARAQLSPAGVQKLIACGMILDGPQVPIRIPVDPAAGGKAAADGIVRYLRLVAARAGVRMPRVLVKPPRKGKTATMSAKAARARDLQSYAEPPGKDLPGGVAYVAAVWAPAISDVIENYQARCSEWPELREIAAMARYYSGEWWTPWLREMEAFTGEDGREDDQVDATVDAFEELAPSGKRLKIT